tara:strand:- start:36 stop:842 length:807 start_codon:yes stop_codon:yes gene_type:complete
MEITHDLFTVDYGYIKKLTSNIKKPRYLFNEHQLNPGSQSMFRLNNTDTRSFVVINGNVVCESLQSDRTIVMKKYQQFEGWHAPPNSFFRMLNEGNKLAYVIEAGSINGQDIDVNDISELSEKPFNCIPLSQYHVTKPWGGETWFTQNMDNLPYALKKIFMTAGNFSSLQSHEVKLETNYVIDGEATVLGGVTAPLDINATIDIQKLSSQNYPVGTGWSVDHRELHRVIANTNYVAIEVSTPELDDVIRWQDKTKRSHGRIETEHRKI